MTKIVKGNPKLSGLSKNKPKLESLKAKKKKNAEKGKTLESNIVLGDDGFKLNE